MAYSTVPTVVTGQLWSASDHNTYVRDNFAAGVPAIISSKGDLVVGSASKAVSRLPIGTVGQALVVDSTQALGLKYATLPVPAMQKIAEITPTFSDPLPVSIASIPQTFRGLMILAALQSDQALTADSLYMMFNDDTGTNYAYKLVYTSTYNAAASLEGLSSGVIHCGAMSAQNSPAGSAGVFEIMIPNYADTLFNKAVVTQSGYRKTASQSGVYAYSGSGWWMNTSAITKIMFKTSTTGGHMQGVISLYGLL